MPVGKGAPTELMPTPDDRKLLYHFNRRVRAEKPILTLDFQHDGEFVGGCIAGGRRYLHINAAGDVEPCVFIHYSNANIREQPLLECLKSPLFMAYYEGQPFNDNLLRPCPMLENPDRLEEMVEKSGARGTDLVETESAHDLAEKCRPAAGHGRPRPSACGRTAPTSAHPTEHASSAAWPKPTRRSLRGSAAPCTGPSIRTAPWTRWHWSRRWPMS